MSQPTTRLDPASERGRQVARDLTLILADIRDAIAEREQDERQAVADRDAA